MKISVLGAGSFGTSMANVLATNGHTTTLWAREPHLVEEILNTHQNSTYLPNVQLHNELSVTTSFADVQDSDCTFLAIPTQYIRSTFEEFSFDITSPIVVNLSKGIEKGTLFRGSQIIQEVGSIEESRFCCVAGPSHAEELAQSIPTAIVAASKNAEISIAVQKIITNYFCRVYTSSDVIGAELGGSLKNVIAIASGIIDGLQLGDNTKAAMFTRGLAEISRLGVASGATMSTFYGLAGIGDLLVTCNSQHSRNRFVGEQIGEGKKLSDILAGMNSIAEGVVTTASAFELSKKMNVEMPITEQVYRILFEDKNPSVAMTDLMTRSSKSEI